MPYEAPSDLAAMSLTQIADAVAARKLPPVDQWNPAESIDSLMRIAADGTWFHDGGPITRTAMVRAFSTLLMRDADGEHWLMTPQYRQSVEVEDAAFLAVDMRAEGDCLAFRLNTDDLIIAGPDNPLRAQGDPDCPAIYLAVRHGCEARIDRSTWLQLVDHALATSDELATGDELAVMSKGARFALIPV